jgi:tetratricopeptide (TPR) repeat protein
MTQPNLPGAPGNGQPTNLSLQGGAAIVAPVSAFPGGVPGNALIVLPLSQPTEELTNAINQGPVALTLEKMWQLLGFNGPAVQVQDAEGRPIAIGLEDLLSGLEKHWQEDKADLNRGRMYAQELMKYGRFDKAEKVMARVVAGGGTGEDWLGLGISQLQQQKWDDAEKTLKGAQNLLQDNPFPTLHLAKALGGKGDAAAEREMIERAIGIDVNCVDAWAYLFQQVKDGGGDEAKATQAVETLANTDANKRSAAPYIALQGFYANNEETRPQALAFAKKGVERNDGDPLALICYSALLGQTGDLNAVIGLLSKHESKMANDVRLANNYFEALFQARQIEKVTKLLNALAGSSNREVKQFAIERSRAVAQYLQQQQQQLAGAGAGPGAGPAPQRRA